MSGPAGAPAVWQESDAIHIDVRGLAPPQPMIAILRLLAGCDPDAAVIAHLDREPVFLYPELAQRGWDHAVVAADADSGEVLLRLARSAP